MCHLILLLPVLSLALFWLLPLSYAVPGYVATALISGVVYLVVIRAMRQPVHDGFHSLVGAEAEVVSRLTENAMAQYLVRKGGELWSAYAGDDFQPGERVNVRAVKGVCLIIERLDKSRASFQASSSVSGTGGESQ